MKTSEQTERGASTLSRRRFLTIAGTGLSFGVVLGAAGVKVFGANGSSPALEAAVGANRSSPARTGAARRWIPPSEPGYESTPMAVS